MSQLFTETLPPKTATLLHLIQSRNQKFLSTFYLSGGTALSLELGHRESEDLDFFSPQVFDPNSLLTEVSTLGTLESTEVQDGTLNTYIDGVKVQFLHYPYSLLRPFQLWDNVRLSHSFDIACTKLQTISIRGSKKDFIDLYILLKRYSLEELISSLERKYSVIHYNLPHILKSLVYFVDAEQQPMPRLHQDIDWEKLKSTITATVKSLDLSSLG